MLPHALPEGLYAGVMSGTSLDAADAVLVRFEPAELQTELQADLEGSSAAKNLPIQILATASLPFPESLRAHLLQLHVSGHNELHHAALLSQQLADMYADVLLQLCRSAGVPPKAVSAAGVHGQTVRHQPDLGYTLQLNQPARIAERSGVSVVADFRSRDMAAGGQGAPLVPAFHAQFFKQQIPCAILNVGGIANLTILRGSSQIVGNAPDEGCGDVYGFDTGPGNMLMDAWIRQHQNQPFDRDGLWAASGTLNQGLLEHLLAEPFFSQPFPKSTGRDQFNLPWLERQLSVRTAWQALPPEDVQVTLLALTAQSVVRAIRALNSRGRIEIQRVIVCGGGSYNPQLLQALSAQLPEVRWQTSDDFGIAPEWMEAVAFAWLARQFMLGLPGNLPTVTGARGPRILGALYPA